MNTPFFFRVNTAAVIAQLIVLDFSAGDLERSYPTSFFLFLGGKGIDQLQHEYSNYSSHHHRSLAGTVGDMLGFGARGC